MTIRVAGYYQKQLSARAGDVQLLSLEHKAIWERGTEMIELEKQYLIPAEKFVLIMPEYNASFPGVLKVLMDNSDVKKCWWYKKAMLVGVSDGRAGNLRGLEHMTAILHYMKVHVLYDKMLLSKINEEMNKEGELLKPETKRLIDQQIEEFLKF